MKVDVSNPGHCHDLRLRSLSTQKKHAAHKAQATSTAVPALTCPASGHTFRARIGLTSHLHTHSPYSSNLKLKLRSSSTPKDKHHDHPPGSSRTGSFPFYPHSSIIVFHFLSSPTNHFHVVVILVQVVQHQLSCLSQSSYHASVFCSWSEISLLTSSIKHGVQRSNNLRVSSKQCS